MLNGRFLAVFFQHILLQVLGRRTSSELEEYPRLVEVFHGSVDHLLRLFEGYPVHLPEPSLQVPEMALDDRIVEAASLARHATYDAVPLGEAQVSPASVQASLVAVYHHSRRHAPAVGHLLQHIPDHGPGVAFGHAVGEDHVVVQVHYRGQVELPSAQYPYFGDVRHELLHRGSGEELLLQKVGGITRTARGPAVAFAAIRAYQTHLAHAPVHRLEVHAYALTFHHRGDLAATVFTAALVEDRRYKAVRTAGVFQGT